MKAGGQLTLSNNLHTVSYKLQVAPVRRDRICPAALFFLSLTIHQPQFHTLKIDKLRKIHAIIEEIPTMSKEEDTKNTMSTDQSREKFIKDKVSDAGIK